MRDTLTSAASTLRSRPGRSVLMLLALTLALTFLTLTAALARGFAGALERHARSSFLAGQVTVQPGVSTLNRNVPGLKYLELEQPGTGLDAAFVARIGAMQGVQRVMPLVAFPYPVTARAAFEGTRFEVDMPLFAVDTQLFDRDADTGVRVQQDEIPVLVSRRLLDIYNLGLVPTASAQLPRLSEDGLRGFRFETEVGFSTFMQTRPKGTTLTVPVRVVGFTDQPSILGAAMTRADAESLLARFAPAEELPATARTVLAFASDERAAERIAAELRGEGYRAQTLAEALAGVSSGSAAATAVLGVLTLLVLLLSFLTVATTMLTATLERTGEIGVLRALGATKGDIVRRFLAEAAMLGLAAGLLAAALGAFTGAAVARSLARLLPDASALAGGIVTVDAWTLLVPIVGGVLVAVLGTLGPALRAAAVPPVVALRSAR